MKLTVKSIGKLKNITDFLNKNKPGSKNPYEAILNKYGAQGVEQLQRATPKDTSEAANSWYYTIETVSNGYNIVWSNKKMANKTPVVVLLQYGHGTAQGAWVQGVDFINPALRGVMEELADSLWKEVKIG